MAVNESGWNEKRVSRCYRYWVVTNLVLGGKLREDGALGVFELERFGMKKFQFNAKAWRMENRNPTVCSKISRSVALKHAFIPPYSQNLKLVLQIALNLKVYNWLVL